jgi:hypothetical protein
MGGKGVWLREWGTKEGFKKSLTPSPPVLPCYTKKFMRIMLLILIFGWSKYPPLHKGLSIIS